MAEKKFESSDPMELVGTLCEGGDESSMDEMACVFVEELARMGWSREQIFGVFQDPFYRGPHTVLRSKGPAYVNALLDQIAGIAPPPPPRVSDPAARSCCRDETEGASSTRVIKLTPI